MESGWFYIRISKRGDAKADPVRHSAREVDIFRSVSDSVMVGFLGAISVLD